MGTSKRRKGALASVVCGALLVGSAVVAPRASAANASWDGDGGNANWSNAANWSAAPPSSGETATFPDGPVNKSVNVDAGGGANLNFTGSGYELELVVLTAFGDVTATGAGTNTIDLHAEMSGSLVTAGAGSTLVFGERVELEGAPMTIDGAGTVQIPGGASALIRDNDVIKNGSGTLVLSGNNSSWSGDLDVNAGVVDLTSSIDTSATVDGGTFNIGGNVGGTIGQTGGLVHLLGPGASVSGATTIADGTFLLDDATTAAGGISQADGVVRCDGTAAVVNGYSGTLDARFDLGAAADEIDGCTVTNGFSLTGPTFNEAGFLEFDIAGTTPAVTHDQLVVTGPVEVDDALLTLDVDNVIPSGTELVLIENDDVDPVVGEFISHPEGALITFGGTGQTFRFSYVGGTGNDVTLTAIPELTVSDVAGSESGPELVFTFVLDAPLDADFTFDVATTDGTAVDGDDYEGVAVTGVTIPAGDTDVEVAVPLLDDVLDEAGETFTIAVSNASGPAVVADGIATGTIDDDDGPPSLTISDVVVVETDGPDPVVQVPVTLDVVSGQDVTFDLTSVDDTAVAPGDYAALATTGFTIPAGDTEVLVPITVVGDDEDEVDEVFTLVLSDVVDAEPTVPEATVTIDDDDGPVVSITDEDALESVDAEFFVTLSAASPQDVSVDYDVVPGTATAADLVLASGTITIPAGEVEALLVVDLLQDALDEPNETYSVVLSSPVDGDVAAAAAEVEAAAGTVGNGVITDDDPAPSVSIADASVTEGTGGTNSVILTLSLSAVSGQPVSATVTTSPGSAGAADFTATSTIVTFPAGTTTATVSIPITTDALPETSETFTAALSSPVAAELGDASATVTIVDDDAGAVAGSGLPRTGVAGVGLLLLGVVLLLSGSGAVGLAGRRR